MNRLEVKKFNLSPSDLSLNPKYIFDLMGYGSNDPGDYMTGLVQDVQKLAPEHMKIQVGFSEPVLIITTPREGAFYINENRFDCGRIISGQIKKSEALVLICATLGLSFDEWSQSYFKKGDPVYGLAADSLGSVMVEAAIEWVDNKVQSIMSERSLFCTNRYSPGYCGWSVSEQHKLFSYLPENFLDIQVTESSLMLPIKSVSGVIGIGKNVKRVDYTCQVCNKTDCYMRRTNEEVTG